MGIVQNVGKVFDKEVIKNLDAGEDEGGQDLDRPDPNRIGAIAEGEEDDEDMLETGEDISSLLDMEFNYHSEGVGIS